MIEYGFISGDPPDQRYQRSINNEEKVDSSSSETSVSYKRHIFKIIMFYHFNLHQTTNEWSIYQPPGQQQLVYNFLCSKIVQYRDK